MRRDAQGIYFVVDARTSPDELLISEYGDRYDAPSTTLVNNFASMTRTMIEPDFYTDEFGTFLSGYAPIYTSEGKLAGVLGVDISANTIHSNKLILIRLISIFYHPWCYSLLLV